MMEQLFAHYRHKINANALKNMLIIKQIKFVFLVIIHGKNNLIYITFQVKHVLETKKINA